MNVLELQKVVRTYGRGRTVVNAVGGVSLTVLRGEFVALMGASGSGKTTLLNLAAGLDRPDQGSVRLLDVELGTLSEAALARLRRRHVGWVFQTLNLVPILTARENIRLPLALNGVGDGEQRTRVDALLEVAGLSDRAGSFPVEMSGGEQQRVAVLRAVAHRPEVIFLDEPTSSLDTANAEVLLELLQELNRREETTLIMTTHDERVAARTRRVIRLRDGKVEDDRANTFS